jgi:hypothetical protein
MAAGFKSVSTIGNIDHPQLFAQLEIPQCSTIGFIENLNNDYFKKIFQIDQESVQQKFSEDLPLPKPLFLTP